MTRYRKAIVAAITALGTIVSFLADGEVSQNDITGIAAAVIGVLGVYFATNEPPAGGNQP